MSAQLSRDDWKSRIGGLSYRNQAFIGGKFAPSLSGKTVALMDIGKSRGKEFIDRLEGHFRKAGIATRRYAKPTNTKVAPTAVMQQIAAEAQLAVIALSD